MIKPYSNSENKKNQVEEMFNNIAPKYDFLNHILSMNIDKIWRKKVINILRKEKNVNILLDIATGTGDLAIQLAKLKPEKIFGIDLAKEMLEIGKKKIKNKNLDYLIELQQGDAENLNFESNKFDAITVAFGVRNFENLNKGLSEIHRVLKPESKFVVLEFSEPQNMFIKKIYYFYFLKILPRIGKIISKDYDAYKYLPESVKNFPHGENFLNELKAVGFKNTKFSPLSLGISTIYVCQK